MLTTQIGDKPHSLLYMTSKANHSSQNVCTDAWANFFCGCPAFAATLTQFFYSSSCNIQGRGREPELLAEACAEQPKTAMLSTTGVL